MLYGMLSLIEPQCVACSARGSYREREEYVLCDTHAEAPSYGPVPPKPPEVGPPHRPQPGETCMLSQIIVAALLGAVVLLGLFMGLSAGPGDETSDRIPGDW
jgi:hypothetical protein